MKKKTTFKENRDEILYKVINSLLAGVLVFLGAFTELANVSVIDSSLLLILERF